MNCVSQSRCGSKQEENIIIECVQKYPALDIIIADHDKHRSKQSGVCVKLEYDIFYIPMSRESYELLKDYEGITIGACCGQSRCYVCQAYGQVHIDVSVMRFEEEITEEQARQFQMDLEICYTDFNRLLSSNS